MKKFIKIILLILVVISCVDDDKLFELSDFENGAIPNLVQTENDDGFINLLDLNSMQLEFTVDFAVNFPQSDDGGITSGGSGRETTNLAWQDVSSFDLELTYSNKITGELEQGVIGNYTSWPATITLKVDDLIAAIPSLNTQADFNLGDQFVFVCGVNLASGKKLPAFVKDPTGKPVPGYSVNINGAGNNPGINYSIAYDVSCPSSIPLGTWTNVTTGGSCLTYKSGGGDVELTKIGSIRYEISDFDFGFYGIATRAQFNDVCNDLTLGGATEFGISWSGSGVFTPNGGVNGKGRLEFPCHFDATFNPGYPEDLVFDKK